MALTPTDWLLAGYIAFLTVVLVARGPLADGHGWLLASHGLFSVLLVMVRRLPPTARLGKVLHTFYPLLLLGGFYSALGILNGNWGLEAILRHDATVQGWEAAWFGGQPSYDWIRNAPSVFWSGLLHLAYLSYYPMILLPGPLLAWRGDWDGARRIVFATMLAFVVCYVVFVLWPVAGPNYAFPHPTGAVREVWSARLVYGLLGAGSSVGAAFPSSHVAATLATVIVTWQVWRPAGAVLILPFVLMTVGVVYCQMHYAVDAAAGLLIGPVAAAATQWLWALWSWDAGAAPVESPAISLNTPRTSRR